MEDLETFVGTFFEPELRCLMAGSHQCRNEVNQYPIQGVNIKMTYGLLAGPSIRYRFVSFTCGRILNDVTLSRQHKIRVKWH